jgi:hypothetical protein
VADRPVKTAALVPRQTGPIRVLVKADRFEVRGDLGAGSTGVVWRVLDRDRGHEVALRPLPAANPEQLLALKDDFRALAEVRHPHVVRVHELVEIEGRLFVSMEIVDGLDLMSWLWGADRASGQHEAVNGEEFSEQETTAKNVLPLIAPSVDHTRLRAGLAPADRRPHRAARGRLRARRSAPEQRAGHGGAAAGRARLRRRRPPRRPATQRRHRAVPAAGGQQRPDGDAGRLVRGRRAAVRGPDRSHPVRRQAGRGHAGQGHVRSTAALGAGQGRATRARSPVRAPAPARHPRPRRRGRHPARARPGA